MGRSGRNRIQINASYVDFFREYACQLFNSRFCRDVRAVSYDAVNRGGKIDDTSFVRRAGRSFPHVLKVPLTLMSNCLVKSSSVVSLISLVIMIPALLTGTSIFP